MLKSFNVFGRVTVTRDRVVISHTCFTDKYKGWPITVTIDTNLPQIPPDQTGELVYAAMVEGENVELYVHELTPVEGVQLDRIPLVREHLTDRLADSLMILAK